MRALMVALAVLAGLKVWTHQALFRAASEQALLNAYTHSAIKACQRTSRKRSKRYSAAPALVDWTKHRSAKVVIGNKSLDVSLWQVEHKMWDARYKTPFIHLKTNANPHSQICIFNVMTGVVFLGHA